MGLARTVYSRASESRALRRPLDAIRSHPRVRAFARRHVEVLLARGTTWANVDGALRLLAEDPRRQIVFGPWEGDALTELLYWAPFVRWAHAHFALEPAGPDAGAPVFPSAPVHALVEAYRSGDAPPRPLLKRARHVRLTPPEAPDGLPESYIAVAAGAPVSPAGPVVPIDGTQTRDAQHALLARATGLIAPWSGLAMLGVLSGVPTVALRSADTTEPDLDLAARIAGRLGVSLTILDTAGLNAFTTALG